MSEGLRKSSAAWSVLKGGGHIMTRITNRTITISIKTQSLNKVAADPSYHTGSVPCTGAGAQLTPFTSDATTFRCKGGWCLPLKGRCNGSGSASPCQKRILIRINQLLIGDSTFSKIIKRITCEINSLDISVIMLPGLGRTWMTNQSRIRSLPISMLPLRMAWTGRGHSLASAGPVRASMPKIHAGLCGPNPQRSQIHARSSHAVAEKIFNSLCLARVGSLSLNGFGNCGNKSDHLDLPKFHFMFSKIILILMSILV